MNLKKFKKLSGDASFRQFYRTNNSVLVYSKIQKRSNLLNYDAVNKILIKNKILAPGLISQNYKKNFIEIEDFGNKNMLDKIKSSKTKLNEYKRRQAPIGIRVSNKAFGIGRRYPVINHFREEVS